MTNEMKKIQKKYARLMKHPEKHTEYLTEWRSFYLKYSHYLATAAFVDEKYFNYIYDFRSYFKKYLEMRMHGEMLKQEDIEKHQESFETISEESDKDCDIKIVEKPVETVEVSSDEDDECAEPEVKKQKVKHF
jgi:hypothetical protein